MNNNYIIAFSNQKGGVGKTTLCVLFANYLVAKGKKVIVVDCDGQTSIKSKRENDKNKYVEDKPQYDVHTLDISNPDKVKRELTALRKQDAIVLLDTPGHISQKGLPPLFALTDYIVVPFKFEPTSIQSTGVFITFIKRLKKSLDFMKSDMIFVVNDWDTRFGKQDEMELYEKTEISLARLGMVSEGPQLRIFRWPEILRLCCVHMMSIYY